VYANGTLTWELARLTREHAFALWPYAWTGSCILFYSITHTKKKLCMRWSCSIITCRPAPKVSMQANGYLIQFIDISTYSQCTLHGRHAGR